MAVIHLHAGLPKTGTTAIQAFLAANRDRLAARGVHLATTGQGVRGDHHDLVIGMGGASWGLRARLAQALDDEIAQAGADQVLVTSELTYFLLHWGLGARGWRRLRARGHALRVHIALRPQVDFAVSAYPEFLRNLLLPHPFTAFVERNFLPFARDYRDVLARLGAVAGAPPAVLAYTAQARAEGVWWGLLASIGLDVPGPERGDWVVPGEVNPSLGPVGVMALTNALRRLEREGCLTRFGQRRDLRDVVLGVTHNFAPEPRRFNPMSRGQRAAIWAACAPANEAVAQAAWGRSWEAVFAAEAAARPPYCTYVRAEDSGADAELHDQMTRRIYRRARARLDEIAAGRRVWRLRRLIATPADRIADRALRAIVRGR